MTSKGPPDSAAQALGPPTTSKYESLTAQLKHEVKEGDKKKGFLSDGEPIVPMAEKTSTQLPGGGQLAAKAFEALESQAQILLDQMKERKLSSWLSILTQF